jgi:AcrR family transcriptional regulator
MNTLGIFNMKTDRYHHGNLFEACIETGLAFFEKGERDFSLRKLAKEIGVSHGAPAKHFGSKEGLIAAIAERGFEILHKELINSLSKDPRKSFLDMGRAYVLFGIEHPSHYRAMLGDKIQNFDYYKNLSFKSKETFGELVGQVERLQKEKLFRKGDSFNIAYCVWSSVHGLVNLAIDDQVKLPISVKPGSKKYQGVLKEHCLKLTDEMNNAFLIGFSIKS